MNLQPAAASAPGKLILFGEHAVVYGVPAIAVALSDLRVWVEVTPLSAPIIEFHLTDLISPGTGEGVRQSLDIQLLRQKFAAYLDATELHKPSPPSAELIATLQEVFSGLGELEEKALKPLLFLSLSVLSDLLRRDSFQTGVRLTASKSSLPVGAGLGSSAAFCVAAATALYYSRPDSTKSGLSDEVFLLGLDNSLSVFGGAARFLREKQNIEQISGFPELKLFLTNTKVPRSTKKLVGDVRALYERYPAIIAGIWKAIEGIVDAWMDVIKNKKGTEESVNQEDREKALEELIDMNQALLRAVGVSHPAIEKVCKVTAKLGIPSKLTGAGGGGCTLSFVPRSSEANAMRAVEELSSLGYDVFETRVGGPGVLLHF